MSKHITHPDGSQITQAEAKRLGQALTSAEVRTVRERLQAADLVYQIRYATEANGRSYAEVSRHVAGTTNALAQALYDIEPPRYKIRWGILFATAVAAGIEVRSVGDEVADRYDQWLAENREDLPERLEEPEVSLA